MGRCRCRRPASFIIRGIFAAMSSAEASSQYIAASPQASGIDVQPDAMTGQPQYIASSGGSPKPSYSDGKIRQPAFSYNAFNSPSDTKPAHTTWLASTA